MWSWFGGQAAQSRRDAPKKAILQLREQLEMLQKRERHLETQIAEQDASARKNISANKTAAKAALRRKKMHEKTLEQTSAQVAQIEQQIYSIEAANINQETLNAMKNAGQAIKNIHSGLSIEKVDQTMETLREQHELAQEIGAAITNAPIGDPLDEAELEEEFENMQQEALDDKMIGTGPLPVTSQLKEPPAPPTAIRQEEDDEEEELRKLQAEMAM